MAEIKTIGDLDAFYDRVQESPAYKISDMPFLIEYYRRMHHLHAEIIKIMNLITPEQLDAVRFADELPPAAKKIAADFQTWVQEKNKSYDSMPDYAISNLSKGLCAVGKFHGQTAVFIPKKTADRIGIDKIRTLTETAFTRPVLDEFKISEYECAHYFLLELPPIKGPDDHRIEKLIESIEKS